MSEPLYLSSTREIPASELGEPLASALREYAARHQLTLEGVRMWLTRRENPPATGFLASLFGRRRNPVDSDPWHDALLVLHPTHVILASHGPARGTLVQSLALALASVARGSVIGVRMGGGLDLPSDDGITFEGFPGDEGRPGSVFAGLGGPMADACFEAVREAVTRAKNPR